MTRPKLVVLHSEPEQSRGQKDVKKYRFELSRRKLVFYALSLATALCWMFILGLLVGRGISLVNSEDISLRAEFMRFLGLGQQTGQPVPKAAETWGDPKKMMESLNYYEDLTGKGTPAATAPPVAGSPEDPAAADPTTEAVKGHSSKRAHAGSPAQPEPERQAPAESKTTKAAPPPPSIGSSEQFTLLVASLKDPENAQRLMDQLKAKGYSPRLEALDLNGGGRWNRVLVGSFQTRDTALKFAAEFNKKESMEGLVIREAN
ncbi:MAG: SPOR domain-containing protein [Syntrophobacter sp.]